MKKLYTLFLLLTMASSTLHAQNEATFYTSEGDFIVRLYDMNMAITTTNFKNLVDAKFYDGVIFHRVMNNFMIQGGDPTGTGSGGPGYTIQDEFDAATSNVKHTISMANTGAPNSAGSQFFINLVDNTYLDFDKAPLSSAHPVFGEVISGGNIVDAIGLVQVNGANKPLIDVTMDSIRITYAVPTSVENVNPEGPKFNVYPNPYNSNSVVAIAAKNAHTVNITVTNSFGQLLLTDEIDLDSGITNYSLEAIEQFPSGLYAISIRDGNQSNTTLLLKK